MILKSLYFNLDRQEYPNDYGYSFLLKSRFYCNFIERSIFKSLKYKTPGFNRIVIKFTDNPKNFYYINTEKVLCVAIKFDKSEYETAKSKSIAEYFISYTEFVFSEIEKRGIELPIKEVKEANKLFVEKQFINKWTFKKKKNKNLNIEATLCCELTESKFQLTLVISKMKQIIFQKELLNLKPDPVAYYYQFKDILFKNDTLIITSHFQEDLFEIKLKDLLKAKTTANKSIAASGADTAQHQQQ